MPELPEVETAAAGLRQLVVGKRIKQVIIHAPKKIFGQQQDWITSVHGARFVDVTRRGKWLILELSSQWSLVIHLKMTGQLLFQSAANRQQSRQPIFLGGHTMRHEQVQLPNTHTRAEFVCDDGSRLFFQDMRLFGYVHLFNPVQLHDYIESLRLGPEPMDKAFSFDYFSKLCRRRSKTSIKALLLDQSAIAGLGNIYVDEACHMARLRPSRRVGSLTVADRRALWQACKRILKQAIKLGGTSCSDHYRVEGTIGEYWNKRRVYGRTNESCPRCRHAIAKTRVAGRGTHYCPNCQV